MMGGPPPSIADKVADHLEKGFHWENGSKVPGGSAFLLFVTKGDDMSAVLKPLGITARTDAMCVHKAIQREGAEDADIVQSAEHTPFIFTFNQWGGPHMITAPLASLQSILLQSAPIQVTHVDGVASTPLIPVPGAPAAPESWGETDLTSIENQPTFDKDADIAGPIYAGAVAEKAGQRVVCMGSEPTFMGSTGDLQQNIVDFPDQELSQKKGIYVPQFPGSADFFMNSVFWLSHQDTMIAISPAAMNISRIGEMSKGVQRFWDIGVLLIGLPGLVLLAGAGVYFSRRD
jgi:hypothetical protein